MGRNFCRHKSVTRHFALFVGFATIFNKEALFLQDMEHLIDVCGIGTPQKLQRKQCVSMTIVLYVILIETKVPLLIYTQLK